MTPARRGQATGTPSRGAIVAMKLALVVLAGAGVLPALARDDVTRLSLEEVLAQPAAAGVLDGSVRLYLAGAETPPVEVRLGGEVAYEKTNATNMPEDVACKRAALSALIELQKGARRAGANAVVDIVSYYRKRLPEGAIGIDCHHGMFVCAVALKGSYVRISK